MTHALDLFDRFATAHPVLAVLSMVGSGLLLAAVAIVFAEWRRGAKLW